MPKKINRRLYVGLKASKGETSGLREVFRAVPTPSVLTHGDKYDAVIGPFRTLPAALFMVHFGQSNPHCVCVNDAEKLAKRHGWDRLRELPRTKQINYA